MAAARGILFAGMFCLSAFCIISWKYSILGVRDAVQLAGRGLLLLALSTWTISCLIPKLKSLLFPEVPQTSETQMDEALCRFNQTRARREQQHEHTAKTNVYQEAVLKPRQDAACRRREEKFYRMTGQRWKLSPGSSVGAGQDEEFEADTGNSDETPNQRAARKRKELEMPRPATAQTEPPKEKRIITLPDEPSENAEGVVKIALRCPSGRTIQRCFLKSCSSLVLLEWLHKSGYSPTLYALFTSYPRQPILTQSDLSIEEVGIITDTALNVGEKDPSTT